MSDTPTTPIPLSRHLTWKRAQNLQVVSVAEAAFAGRLDDFQFDLDTHRIYGWRVKGGGVWPSSGAVAAKHVLRIGRDVALIDAEGSVHWGSGARKTTDGRAWASGYRGIQAITRRGRSLGAVQDFVLEADGRRLTGILLHGDRLLALDGRVHAGPSAVIVEAEELVVELGTREEDAEDTRWWTRLREALGVKEDRPPAGEGRLAEVPAELLPQEDEEGEEDEDRVEPPPR